jgi:hypothetical protein
MQTPTFTITFMLLLFYMVKILQCWQMLTKIKVQARDKWKGWENTKSEVETTKESEGVEQKEPEKNEYS